MAHTLKKDVSEVVSSGKKHSQDMTVSEHRNSPNLYVIKSHVCCALFCVRECSVGSSLFRVLVRNDNLQHPWQYVKNIPQYCLFPELHSAKYM